jgi:hypothetical protein
LKAFSYKYLVYRNPTIESTQVERGPAYAGLFSFSWFIKIIFFIG